VTQVVSFTAVDDFGKIINPMIVEGQVHGGLTQGIGQALTENCLYNADGQLLSGTLSDYAIPRATDVPLFKVDTRETPCTHNPLGVKGCGEAGAIGAPAAVMNAITDALGLKDVAMPATAQNVWRAMHTAR
jgi:carbon-monoxide dehydrogenase large subunit